MSEAVTHFLHKNVLFVLERIKLAEITNLRTVFFFFDNLTAILEQVPSELKEKFGKQLIHSTLIYSNEYKEGRLESYSSVGDLPSYFHFQVDLFRSFEFIDNYFKSGQLHSDAVNNEADSKEDVLRKDFYRKYDLPERQLYFTIDSIFDLIKTGFLDSKALNTILKEHSDKQIPIEVEAFSQINPFRENHLELNDEDFFKNVSIVFNAVREHQYDLFDFLNAFNVIQELIKNGFIKIEQYVEFDKLEDFFVQHLSGIEKNTLPEKLKENSLQIQSRGFSALVSNEYQVLFNKTEEIYRSFELKVLQNQFEEKFPSFEINPLIKDISQDDLELFIQTDPDKLIQFAKTALTEAPKSLHTAFENLLASGLPKGSKLQLTLSNLIKVQGDLETYSKDVDFSKKPISKFWFQSINKGLKDKITILETEQERRNNHADGNFSIKK